MSQSKTKLVDLINAANFPPIPLTTDNVELTDPLPTAEGGAQFNTRVTVTAKANKGYKGTTTMFYRRLPLSVIGENLLLQGQDINTPQDLLDVLNFQYGAWLDLEDLLPFTVPDITASDQEQLTLSADAGSFGWIGSITLTLLGSPMVNVSNAELITT